MFQIQLKGISKSFGTLNVLAEVSLSISKSEFVALCGKSGSGKSTLLNIIGALDKADSGDLIIDDKNILLQSENELANFRVSSLGFIFQSFHLEPTYSVYKNIEIPLLIAKMPKSERQVRIKEVLAKVDLLDKINQKTSVLSGGEKQRVAIARALSNNPKIILADEPTGNLDLANGKMVMDILRNLSSEGITIVLVTHSEHDAAMADRIIYLKDGKIDANNTRN
ncbi:MAG: ABC transporter ATP-binding protein [Firmicutes bacterium]|nr:ABC transporter ATP-binding protein [Bacillota bacterium]